MKSQDVTSPQKIKAVANQVIEVTGNLNEGVDMPDLSWAWSSSNACFPSIRQHLFNGKHVLYTTELLSYSEMEVELIPAEESMNISLYAYQVGLQNDALVPDLPRCIRCEVDHHSDRPFKGKKQTSTRKVDNLVALRNPYRVVIGVAGAEGLSEADYTLRIKLKKR